MKNWKKHKKWMAAILCAALLFGNGNGVLAAQRGQEDTLDLGDTEDSSDEGREDGAEDEKEVSTDQGAEDAPGQMPEEDGSEDIPEDISPESPESVPSDGSSDGSEDSSDDLSSDSEDVEDMEIREYIKEAQKALEEVEKEEPVMALVYLCENYSLKKSPGTEGGDVAKLPSGTTVFIQGVGVDEDFNLWYQVTAELSGKTYTGYILREYLAYSNELFLAWEDNYFPKIAMFASGSGSYPDVEQFPASYRDKLMRLKQAHPSWIFVKQNTNLEWQKVVAAENYKDRNLVNKTEGAAYRGEYYGQGWYYASEGAVKYYLDPRNFLDDTRIFQFEQLTYNPSYHSKAAVQNILSKTFMKGQLPKSDMTYADAFFKIGVSLKVSPFHLACRVYQEQGAGTSPLISGNYDVVPEYKGYYNYFNIGASGTTDKQVIESGLKRARKEGWNTPYASLNGGAGILSVNYILRGQDTLYLQKFDVDASDGTLYTHQYMQNIMAPYSESAMVKKAYAQTGALDNPFVFKIPVYNNMPQAACPVPTATATPKPTATPTLKPTATPTSAPTLKPAATPTLVPTADPTSVPTATPTLKPTSAPTSEPAEEPTQKPVVSPTSEPAGEPTQRPAVSPTSEPAEEPTQKPAATPTSEPADGPSPKPTVASTATPASTAKATLSPTATPASTAKATSVPTAAPASTAKATSVPTATPVSTAKATSAPTAVPAATAKATLVPTAIPAASSAVSPGPEDAAATTPAGTPAMTPAATASPIVTETPEAGTTPAATATPMAVASPVATATAVPTATAAPATATAAPTAAIAPTSKPGTTMAPAAAAATPTESHMETESPASGSDPGNSFGASILPAATASPVQASSPEPVSSEGTGNGEEGTMASVSVNRNTNSAGVTVTAATPKPYTESGEKKTISMDMSKTGMIYAQTLQQIREQEMEAELKVSEKASWYVDGSTMESDGLSDINLGVTFGESRIPKDRLAILTENERYLEMSLAHEGEFGFTIVLSVKLEDAQPGQYANLFYYNEETGDFEFMCASVIGNAGSADFEFSHASDYVIIISGETKETLVQEKAAALEEADKREAEAIAQAKEELPAKEPGKAALIIALILLGSAAIGIAVYLVIKRKDER